MSLPPSPLLTLDRIVELEPGHHGRAVSHVTNTMDVLDTHFPRFPVLPGVLVIDAIGRLCSLVMAGTGKTSWRMAGAEKLRFRHYVQPGDQLELSVRVTEARADSAKLSAEARVGDRIVVTVGRVDVRMDPEI